MSHNTIKVSSKTANRDNEITLNLSDVSSVSSPANSEILSYNGTNWTNRLPNWVNTYERAINSLNGYSSINGNYTIILNYTDQPAGFERALYWHKTVGSTTFTSSAGNTDNDAELKFYNVSGSTFLYYGVRINNPGLYRLYMKFALNDVYGTDNSSVEVQWSNKDNTVTYSPKFRLHMPHMKTPPCIGYIDASGGEDVVLYKHALYNTPKTPLGLFRDYLCIIEKLS